MKSLLTLVGISHALGRDVTEKIGNYVAVVLVREPANPFDPNAIKVYVPIGYIKKEQAAKLAPKLDYDPVDKSFIGEVVHVLDGVITRNEGHYAEIEIEEPNAQTPPAPTR